MSRTAFAILTASLVVLVSPASAAGYGSVCRAPVSATAHGQQADPQAPNFGEDLARKHARIAWERKVRFVFGQRFANIALARSLSYTDDPGAGQIHVTVTATPCR